MKLYYYTPYYKHSDFMAHLTEHLCVYPDISTPYWCLLWTNISWSLQSELCSIWFNKIIPLQTIFDIVNKQISQDMVDYEMKIFEEEFWDVSYINKVLEKVNKSLIDPDRTAKPQKYTLDEIKAYHHQYIVEWKYILFDPDHWEIIQHNLQDIDAKESDYSIGDIKAELYYFEWAKNYVLYSKSTPWSILFFYMLYEIIEWRDGYQKRYVLESYYTHRPSDTYSKDFSMLRISPHAALNITEEFFLEAKKYYINQIQSKQFMSIEIMSLLYHNHQIDREKAVVALSEFSFSDYQTIAWMINVLNV